MPRLRSEAVLDEHGRQKIDVRVGPAVREGVTRVCGVTGASRNSVMVVAMVIGLRQLELAADSGGPATRAQNLKALALEAMET